MGKKNGKDVAAAAEAFIREHLKEDITVSQVAEEIQLNADYMTRLFKKETGLTIKEYIVNMRMERAMELLRVSDLSVRETAQEAGYHNCSYFVRQFREKYGMTPRQYRIWYR